MYSSITYIVCEIDLEFNQETCVRYVHLQLQRKSFYIVAVENRSVIVFFINVIPFEFLPKVITLSGDGDYDKGIKWNQTLNKR